MDGHNKEVMRWIAAVTLCAAALLFFLRMAVIWRDVDTVSGLFLGGSSLLCTLFNGIATALLIGALAAALLARRLVKRKAAAPRAKRNAIPAIPAEGDPFFAEEFFPEEEAEDAPPVDPDLRTASTWEGTLSAFSYFLPGFGFLFFAMAFVLQGTRDKLTGKQDVLILLFCILCAACGGYFLIAGVRNRTDKNVPMAFAGLIPAVWATLRMIIEYRDLEKYANRGMYIANLIFLVSLVCFFIYQAQITLGHDAYAMPLSWFASALLVLLFGLSARLPQLLGILFDRLGDMDLVDAAGLLLDLSLTLFAGLKIRRMLR